MSGYSLKFIIRNDKPNSLGFSPIYLRYTSQRKYYNIPTNLTIKSNQWNKIDGEPKRNYPNKNEMMISLQIKRNEIEKVIMTFFNTNKKFPSVDTIKKIVNNVRDGKLSVIELYNKFKRFGIENKKIELSTLQIYENTWFHLTEFFKVYERELTLENFDTKMGEDLINFLMGQGKKNNTIGKIIKTLKTFLNYVSVHHKLISSDQFKSVKRPKDDVDVHTLSTKELEYLKHHVFFSEFHLYEGKKVELTDRERFVGQILIFLCNTGLSFVDFEKLTYNNIFQNDDLEFGTNLVIKTTRAKIKKPIQVIIPLNDDVLEIIYFSIGYFNPNSITFPLSNLSQKSEVVWNLINSIRSHKNKIEKPPYYPRIFQPISNSDFNKEIKEILKKIGGLFLDPVFIVEMYKNKVKSNLSKPKYELVHSHIGRKSFITISLEKGVQPHILMKSTGHTKYDTMFRKYSKISDNAISREFRQKLGKAHPSKEYLEKKEKEMYFDDIKYKLNPKFNPKKPNAHIPQWISYKVKKKRPRSN